MHMLVILGTIGWMLWILRNVSFWVGLFQIKEYRRDRLLVHLRETRQGKSVLFSFVSFIKWGLLVAYMGAALYDGISSYLAMAVFLLYGYEGVVVCYEIITHRIKRPTITGKAVVISLVSVLVVSVLFFFPLVEYSAWLLFLDRITVGVISLFVFFFAFPTELYVDWKIKKATEKMREHKKVLVIAVSGSYGKSSTKEYISQVLSSTFTVIKTTGSNNTPIGIAQTILNNIDSKTDIFVVEMGAYKKGEIAQLAQMVPPTISVTTSVSDQHLSLFGSVKNAMETEMELIDALPKDGLALFNGNNENTALLYTQTKKNKAIYQLETKEKVGIRATDITVSKNGIHCVIVKGTEKMSIFVPLLGKHMLENVLPAVYIALHLGISKKSIQASLEQLVPPPKTMIMQTTHDGITLVDDTFNASPESVSAAMEYLQVSTKRRIFVLTPLIELGKHAPSRHHAIGVDAAKKCDYLFLTNNNFYDDIMQGVMEGGNACIVKVDKPLVIAQALRTLVQRGDIVMFEGKEAGLALRKFL